MNETALGGAAARLTLRDALAVGGMVAVCLAVRLLELSERPIVPYFTLSDELLRAPWRMLLPLDIGDGYSRWSATGLVIVGLLQLIMSASAVFLVLNVALIVAAFGLAWRASGSRPFAYALAACMAATTQYHWSFINAGVLPLYLTSAFLLWQLAAFAWIAWEGLRGAGRRPRVEFVVSLLALALSWEQWLDYWLFAMCMGALLLALSPRFERVRRADVRWAMVVMAVLGVVYIAVKLATATEHGTPGKESELVFGYLTRDGLGVANGAVLAIEDMVSNFFTYTYLALTNFLPAGLMPGQSLARIPLDAIVGAQRGYHPQMAHLVGYHHVFYWYLFAGVLTTALVGFTAWTLRRAIRDSSPAALAGAALGLLVLLGSATHLLIKYRPYLSEPLLHYKAGIGVTGAGVLFAYGFALLWRSRTRRGRLTMTLAGSLLLFWGMLSRPPGLSAMSSRLQMGTLADPAGIAMHEATQALHRNYTPAKQRVLRAIGR